MTNTYSSKTAKEQLIEKIMKDIEQKTIYVPWYSDYLIDKDDVKQVLKDTIPEQVDYESKIKDLIVRWTNIKEKNIHPINIVYFLEDLQSLLSTKDI